MLTLLHISDLHFGPLYVPTVGEALIQGLLSSGWREPGDISASTRREERVAELRERHGIEERAEDARPFAFEL